MIPVIINVIVFCLKGLLSLSFSLGLDLLDDVCSSFPRHAMYIYKSRKLAFTHIAFLTSELLLSRIISIDDFG